MITKSQRIELLALIAEFVLCQHETTMAADSGADLYYRAQSRELIARQKLRVFINSITGGD